MSLYAHDGISCGPLQIEKDIAHDSDINAVSKMACVGKIGQQSNGDCGNSPGSRRSLMSRGWVPAEGIPHLSESLILTPCAQPNGGPGLDPRRDAVKSQPAKVTLLAQRKVPSGESLLEADVARPLTTTRSENGPDRYQVTSRSRYPIVGYRR